MKRENLILRATKRVLGTYNTKQLKKYSKILAKINKLEATFENYSDQDLASEVLTLKQKYSQGIISLDLLREYSFAICREVAKRKIGMRHYDVQIIGGLVLSDGNVAEMKTGEGKTLVATLVSSAKAIEGNQVHLVTVNDYLAKRDAEIMAPVYQGMGLKVSYLQQGMNSLERTEAYSADIVYGTNSEFAFDFLRKNIAPTVEEQCQKRNDFALVDEVDSILIDEARTPLIISGHGDIDSNGVDVMNKIIGEFTFKSVTDEHSIDKDEKIEEDIILFVKSKGAQLTDSGYDKLEELLLKEGVIESKAKLYEQSNLYLAKMMETAARAHYLYVNNVDYLIHEDEVKIINSSTGRVEEGRRWTDGLHQAIEKKESVEVKPDNTTVASISLQNFFRQYKQYAGMTGTGDTEAKEFSQTYNMDVIVIPTNKPVLRVDNQDKVYLTKNAKYKFMVQDIIEIHKSGRPILIGTDSVEESEFMSNLLSKHGLVFETLNAKNHKKEAGIIANAGKLNAITISTNMAGRGTDILLGGNESSVDSEDEKVQIKMDRDRIRELGGLHVIGTTRNESRRVDNQLRGRSGRQGDPGSSQFYVSLEDRLMVLYNGASMKNFLQNTLGLTEDDLLQHRNLNSGISKAQEKCESQGFNARSELLKYDEIVNLQRNVVYTTRQEWLEFKDKTIEDVKVFAEASCNNVVDKYLPYDSEGLDMFLATKWGVEPFAEEMTNNGLNEALIKEELTKRLLVTIDYVYNRLILAFDGIMTEQDVLKSIVAHEMIRTLDGYWFEQISLLDELREGIHLRAYAQKNPLLEYGESSVELFRSMIDNLQIDYVTNLIESMHNNTLLAERIKNQVVEAAYDVRIEEEGAKATN